MPDGLTARPQSARPTVELPWIVQADGGLRSGQRRHEQPGHRLLTPDGRSVAKRPTSLIRSATGILAAAEPVATRRHHSREPSERGQGLSVEVKWRGICGFARRATCDDQRVPFCRPFVPPSETAGAGQRETFGAERSPSCQTPFHRDKPGGDKCFP